MEELKSFNQSRAHTTARAAVKTEFEFTLQLADSRSAISPPPTSFFVLYPNAPDCHSQKQEIGNSELDLDLGAGACPS